MSSLKMLTLMLFFTLLSACSLMEPFVDRRRNAGAENPHMLYVGHSQPRAPVICYNGLLTTDEELQAMADAECKKHGTGDHAVFKDKKMFSCRLFLPARAYYTCEKNIEESK